MNRAFKVKVICFFVFWCICYLAIKNFLYNGEYIKNMYLNDDVNNVSNEICEDYEIIVELPKNFSDKIYEIIKMDIYNVISQFISNGTINYKITYQSERVVSIKYTGILFNRTSYPINFIYGSNIDLCRNKVIELEDFVEVDNNFIQVLKNSNVIIENENLALEKARKSYIKEITLEKFNEIYNSFYIEDRYIIIIIEARHAIGDYIEMKIPINRINLINRSYFDKINE